MGIFTFLNMLLDTGKAEGNLKDAALWLISIQDEIKAGLPDGVSDYVTPTVDKLFSELDGAVSKLTLKGVLEEMIAFATTIKAGLDKPDSRAGVGV